MDNIKDDVYYIQKVRNDLAFIKKHMQKSYLITIK